MVIPQKIKNMYDTASLLMDTPKRIESRVSERYRDIQFIAALFITDKRWKIPRIYQQMNK